MLAIAVLARTSDRSQWRQVMAPITLGLAVTIVTLIWLLPSLRPNSPVPAAVSGVARAANGAIFPSANNGADAANSLWRLRFWIHDIRYTVVHPVSGIGSGPGSHFRYHNQCSDFHATYDDVKQHTGPHNSYVNVMFRLGFPGLFVLLFLVVRSVRFALHALAVARSLDPV